MESTSESALYLEGTSDRSLLALGKLRRALEGVPTRTDALGRYLVALERHQCGHSTHAALDGHLYITAVTVGEHLNGYIFLVDLARTSP